MLNKSALPITYCANWITSGIFIEWLQLVSNNGSIIDNAGDPKIADDSEEEVNDSFMYKSSRACIEIVLKYFKLFNLVSVIGNKTHEDVKELLTYLEYYKYYRRFIKFCRLLK
ncbi:hypothetical protein RIR_jg2356.t1 [Rhizophagus irregularis DAOM 181602=DAOM 197198]|nr:hypothetical protein RIR_jg2356.t1 [Rhizophagus irregularis DAOM 181602=DAOM 197198]